MATKTADPTAAKARKQKIILAVAGVALLALAAIQVPKLLSQGGGAAAPPPAAEASATAAGASPSSTAPAPTGAAVPAATIGKTVAYVAGVPLAAPARAEADTGQLVSFTLFEVKDPFVPKVSESSGSGAAAAEPSAAASSEGPAATGSEKPASGSNAGEGSAAPEPIAYATITLNGAPQQVKVKGMFPESEPLFVLRSVGKKQARIGIVGGSLVDGQAVTLARGKAVTLVDTATGVRYVLKLVYTGTSPEVIKSFSSDKKASASGTTDSSSDPSNVAVTTPPANDEGATP